MCFLSSPVTIFTLIRHSAVAFVRLHLQLLRPFFLFCLPLLKKLRPYLVFLPWYAPSRCRSLHQSRPPIQQLSIPSSLVTDVYVHQILHRSISATTTFLNVELQKRTFPGKVFNKQSTDWKVIALLQSAIIRHKGRMLLWCDISYDIVLYYYFNTSKQRMKGTPQCKTCRMVNQKHVGGRWSQWEGTSAQR